MVSNIFLPYFYPYLGKMPILTNIFQRSWNHQLDILGGGFSDFLPEASCNAWLGLIYCPPGWVFGRLIHLHSRGGGENGGMFLPPSAGCVHPGNFTWNPNNHPTEKANHLNQTKMDLGSILIFAEPNFFLNCSHFPFESRVREKTKKSDMTGIQILPASCLGEYTKEPKRNPIGISGRPSWLFFEGFFPIKITLR